MCGFIAQLVEHRTGLPEVTGSNPVEALIFFSGFFFPIAEIGKYTAMIILHFEKVFLGHKHDSACSWQFWEFHCVRFEDLLQHELQNVSTSYIVPLSENVILTGTVICHSLKT